MDDRTAFLMLDREIIRLVALPVFTVLALILGYVIGRLTATPRSAARHWIEARYETRRGPAPQHREPDPTPAPPPPKPAPRNVLVRHGAW